ncbi:MAG: sensor histidine kinase N-terminal domain-containing protein [Rhodocyclaceae bacterium]|nr:sensor histidine kinase N-terminal domain-containing protein [Rhodocyclaceae bacterium]MBX3668071.1 sensor histidine kinase N-terminal domain-containing protein [Rhodocyclaceae bacterium]
MRSSAWPRSLNARLTLLVLALMLAGGGLLAMVAWWQAVTEADELFDAQLAQLAQTLLGVAERSPDAARMELSTAVHKYQSKLLFQVWHLRGVGTPHLQIKSFGAPDAALPAPADGYGDAHWDGREWRLYAETNVDSGMRAILAQDHAVRDELAEEVARHALLPLAAGGVVLAATLGFAVRRALAPLRRLTAAVDARTPRRLTALELPDTPRELEPVVAALNELFERVDATLQNERRFTADAAHELRTPLAALQAQVQAAQLAPDGAARREALDKCLQAQQRMTHLVEQLLTLARLEAHAVPALQDTDATSLLQNLCADLAPHALAAGVELDLSAPPQCPVRAQGELLSILARNLIDNAIRYSPRGGRVSVTLEVESDNVCLGVEDSGPGVAPEQLARLGERFLRLAPQQAPGVGLGLSIVRRIATLHRAGLNFSNRPEGGLQVRLVLQRA